MKQAICLSVFLSSAALLGGCGGAPPPPAEQPERSRSEEPVPSAEPSTSAEPAADVASGGEGAEAQGEGPAAAAPSAAQRDDSVPDDYSLMRGDCVALERRFVELTRSDQSAALSPALTAQQRAETEAKIEAVATKLGEQYMRACEQNVGKSVDPKALKCAFNARTVKAFEECLNGPSPAP